MIMDHDIAMADCAALKLKEGPSLPLQEPDSHEDQRGDGQGPSASAVAWLQARLRHTAAGLVSAPVAGQSRRGQEAREPGAGSPKTRLP